MKRRVKCTLTTVKKVCVFCISNPIYPLSITKKSYNLYFSLENFIGHCDRRKWFFCRSSPKFVEHDRLSDRHSHRLIIIDRVTFLLLTRCMDLRLNITDFSCSQMTMTLAWASFLKVKMRECVCSVRNLETNNQM